MRAELLAPLVVALLAWSSGGPVRAQARQPIGPSAVARYDMAGLATCLERAVDRATWGGLDEALGRRSLEHVLARGWRIVDGRRELVVLALEPTAVESWTFAVWLEEAAPAPGFRVAADCQLLVGPTERLTPDAVQAASWRLESVSYSESCRWREVRLEVDDGDVRLVEVTGRTLGPPGDCRLQ